MKPGTYPPPKSAGEYHYRLKNGTYYTGLAFWNNRTIPPTLIYRNSIEAENDWEASPHRVPGMSYVMIVKE